MKYQFNRTALQKLEHDLEMRRHALPTLKSRETALRIEIKKLIRLLKRLEDERRLLLNRMEEYMGLWTELPDLLSIETAEVEMRNIAGEKIPFLKDITFQVREYSLFANRAWAPGGIELLKELVTLEIQLNLVERGCDILQRTRRKTTQKVNLYEKIQIPELESVRRKIKRFIEDEENLAYASQKIVKTRQQLSGGVL